MTYAMHDRALRALRGAGPELRNGAPNHAPMVVEALAALGRGEAVADWVEIYRPRLAEGPRTDAVLGEDWQAALGNFGRLGEWQNLFRRELTKSSWKEVLERWLPRVISGSMAAGTHGIIRCGHATRALQHEVTSPRLEELADALAYCAARCRTLSSPPRLVGDLDLPEAIRAVPLLPPDIDRRGPPPAIVQYLNGHADFAAAVRQLAPPPDPLRAVTELAEIGARLYLGNVTCHPLVLLHAVTGPAALQLILANTSVDLHGIAFAYMWQAFAAWVAAFSTGLPSQSFPAANASWAEIIELTVASGDEHAIKLTEACHRLEARRPSSVFCAAASDWVHRVIETRNWSPSELVEAGVRVRLSDE